LTTALFEETENEKYSSVVVLIKEKDAEKITKFEDFKGKSACFPEFGGIGEYLSTFRKSQNHSHLHNLSPSFHRLHKHSKKPRNLQT
jgi:hypothetical protein